MHMFARMTGSFGQKEYIIKNQHPVIDLNLRFMNVKIAADVFIEPSAPKHREIGGWSYPKYL